VIIDHFGNVSARAGKTGPAFKILMDLMGESHIWLKISSGSRSAAPTG